MAEPLSSSLVLMAVLTGLAFGSKPYFCKGDNIEMFKNITFKNNDTTVHLYKNDEKDGPIAWWTSFKHNIIPNNVVMDGAKNIWILKVHTTDAGTYMLQYDVFNESTHQETFQLLVLVAPEPTCIPKLQHVGTLLIAFLDHCGTPELSVYWKNYSDIVSDETHVLKLQPNKGGIYYACLKGPALRCARSSDPSSDYCSSIKIPASSIQGHTGGDTVSVHTSIIAVLAFLVLALVAAFVMCVIFRKKLTAFCDQWRNGVAENVADQVVARIEERLLYRAPVEE